VRHPKIGNVHFGPKADIAAPSPDVRFTPESGHRLIIRTKQLLARR
jgi:hypothetical protein